MKSKKYQATRVLAQELILAMKMRQPTHSKCKMKPAKCDAFILSLIPPLVAQFCFLLL
jgi:hypothetical protein